MSALSVGRRVARRWSLYIFMLFAAECPLLETAYAGWSCDARSPRLLTASLASASHNRISKQMTKALGLGKVPALRGEAPFRIQNSA